MELWGFEKKHNLVGLSYSLNQEAGSVSMDSGVGGNNTTTSSSSTELHPSHQVLSTVAQPGADLTHGAQYAMATFQQAPNGDRGRLIPDPHAPGSWNPGRMWSYVVSYNENGTPGLQEDEMAAIQRAVEALPEFDGAIHRDSAPIISTYDPNTRRLINTRENDSNYPRFQLARQRQEEQGGGGGNTATDGTGGDYANIRESIAETKRRLDRNKRRFAHMMQLLIALAGEDVSFIRAMTDWEARMMSGSTLSGKSLEIQRLRSILSERRERIDRQVTAAVERTGNNANSARTQAEIRRLQSQVSQLDEMIKFLGGLTEDTANDRRENIRDAERLAAINRSQ